MDLIPEIGLHYGISGVIHDIISPKDHQSIPDAIVVEFPTISDLPTESRIVESLPKVLPITPITV